MEMFFSDNYIEDIKKAVNKYAPFCKVALFVRQVDALNLLRPILTELKKNNKTINLVFPANFELSVDKICGVFNLHEDVRVVISIGEELFDTACYVASIRNIPVICVLSPDSDACFKKNIFIKNAGVIDKINNNCKRTLIYKKPMHFNRYHWLKYIAHKQFELFDYYSRSIFLGENFDSLTVLGILNQLNCAEQCLMENGEHLSEEFFEKIENVCKLNFLSKEVIFETSPTQVTYRICQKPLDVSTKLALDLKVISAIKKAMQGKNSLPLDYNEISNKVAKKLMISENFAAKNILVMLKRLQSINKKERDALIIAVKKAEEYLKQINNIENCSFDNVKLCSETKSAFSISGHTVFGVNLMTISKEYSFI